MKLYYSPFACSLPVHIVCREAGLEVTLERAELETKRVEGGRSLFDVNPMGQVPTLVTDEGHTLTEVTAVLCYVADRAPEKRLAPPYGDFQRYELQRWLSFVGTEVHKKGLASVFTYGNPEAVKDYGRATVVKPLAVLAKHLEKRKTLIGDSFTIADAYLFWALTIAPFGGVSLEAYPALREYQHRHLMRPTVQAAVHFDRTQRERPFAA